MAVDGHLNFDTSLESLGFEQGLKNIERKSQETADAVQADLTESLNDLNVETVSGRINAIANDVERSASSRAAGIAAIYREQGLDQKSAMMQAWKEIERETKGSNSNIAKDTKATAKNVRGWWNTTWADISDDANHCALKLQNGIGTMKKMLGELATAVGLAYSVKALADFGRQSVELASDMQEVQNVVDTAFGAMAYKMEDFAESSITQYGISNLAAKQTGSTFAAMASGMQLPLDAASDMAIALTGLSADMASFYNVSQDVASTALKSVFTGETETLKQFGIVMTEANLNAFAMSQGIGKTVREMTEAEKVMLRYQYVMQATALAQGDFAKTSGGWANQMRIMSEQWKEFSTIVGNVILNVALPAVRHLNDALGKLVTHANNAYNALAEFMGWEQTQTVTAGIVTEISTAVTEQNALTNAIEETTKAQENSLAGFDKINKLSGSAQISETASPSVPATVTPSVNTAPAQEAVQKTAKETQTIFAELVPEVDFTPLLGSLERLKDAAAPIVGHIGGGLRWCYDNVLVPLGTWVIEDALPVSLDVFSGALDVLDASIEALKPYGQWLWDSFISPLAEWSGDIITTGLEKLSDVLHDVADWIRRNPDAAVRIGAVTLAVTGLYAAINRGAITAGLAKLGGFLKTLGALNVTVGVIVAGVIAWGYAITELSNNWEDICDVFEESGGAFGFISGWLEYVREDVEEFFKMGDFGAAWYDFWESAGETLYDFINGWIDFFDGFGQGIYIGTQAIVGYFRNGWTNIKRVFSGSGTWAEGRMNSIKSAFSNAPGWFSTKFAQAYSNVKGAFSGTGAWFEDLNSQIEGAFSTVDSYLGTKFGDGWTNIKEKFSGAKSHFETVWNDMKTAFANGDVGGWFREQFQAGWDSITSVFDGMGGYWQGIWDGISSGARDWVNSLLDKLDALGYHIETLLNGLVDGFNSVLSFNIPEHVPIVGGTSFGLNMAYVDIPPIPRLATGTVVPANYGEFLAVLGDNRRETEVVSPLSTIERALENVMNRRKPQQQGGDIHLNVTLDGKTVYKTVIRKNNESIRMTGKNPLNPSSKGVAT